jgi:hypothetical protein
MVLELSSENWGKSANYSSGMNPLKLRQSANYGTGMMH